MQSSPIPTGPLAFAGSRPTAADHCVCHRHRLQFAAFVRPWREPCVVLGLGGKSEGDADAIRVDQSRRGREAYLLRATTRAPLVTPAEEFMVHLDPDGPQRPARHRRVAATTLPVVITLIVLTGGAPSLSLASPAAEPVVTWSGLTQIWWQGAVPQVRDGGVDIVVARPMLLMGLKAVSVTIQPELAGTPRLLDAILAVRVSARHELTLGRYRTPFTRTTIIGLPGMDVTRRGVLDTSLGFDRQSGLMTTSTSADSHWDVRLGLFDARATSTARLRPLGTARVVYSPFGAAPETLIGGNSGLVGHRLSLGVNLAAEPDRVTTALEATWAGPTATSTVTAYSRSSWGGADTAFGGVARGSVVVVGPWLRLAGRVEALRDGETPIFIGTTLALDATPIGPSVRTLLELTRGQGGASGAQASWTARFMVQGQL